MNTTPICKAFPKPAPALISVCAWCLPNVGGENVTHGICPRHQAWMLNDARRLAEWDVEPAVIVRRHPTGGWSHAVKQARPGVRIFRGWWHSSRAAAEALSPHVARTGAAA